MRNTFFLNGWALFIYKCTAIGLCDFYFDRYCDCDLICDFKFAKSSFSSILSIMCSKKKKKKTEIVTVSMKPLQN